MVCDEGVYHIAREITMSKPFEFDNLVLCLGSFHMIKVVMGAIGKFINGSGAETILVESKAFGQHVVRSVLDGSHYSRSLKGLLMLSECMERLQWAEFFKMEGIEKYRDELEHLRLLKNSVAEKKREESKVHLEAFMSNSEVMVEDFNKFRCQRSATSETFTFWDHFVRMVAVLKDLVRADREGDWKLHLQSVQSVLPLFAGCDRVNYFRWASLYLEDIRKLPEDVYKSFLAGKFVVKRTHVPFSAVGADMCLEQTINRSQKSAGGIIGSTKKKQFVAQWEIIYHEMLAVINLQRQVSGVVTPSTELIVNHEFNLSATRSSEVLIQDMIEYVKEHDNPMTLPGEGDKEKLHNILTQEIMTKEIRDNLLEFGARSTKKYETFRNERIVMKHRSIFDTIHRTNLKTFKSMKGDQSTYKSTNKETKKQMAETQKIYDIARVRGYDMKHLMEFDLIDSSYLFDKNGLMTKPNKSELCNELEKHLEKADYILQPSECKPANTVTIIDVMAGLRRMRVSQMNTFGELCDKFLEVSYGLSRNSKRVDFIFDTYIEGSVKDSERTRRCSSSPIDLYGIGTGTQLPVTMDAFWASSANKSKLQKLLQQCILTKLKPMTDTVVSSIGRPPEIEPCLAIFNGKETPLRDLDTTIEEADVRIIPHARHAVENGTKRVVIISNDTDVVILALHYWSLLKAHGLQEMWIRAGVGNTTRYIPLHVLGEKLGSDTSKILVALHHLTGCDSTSKFGTKAAALKADPVHYLSDFGKELNCINFILVEEFLVNVYKSGTSCRTMDELRYYLYHHSKKTILELPPTSRSVRGHVLRAFFGTYLQLHCVSNPQLDPRHFGFIEEDGNLQPDQLQVLLPDDFALPCKCTSCSTKRCVCRQLVIKCCPYCKCQVKGCQNLYH